MAIIYTYPVKGTPLAADLLLISDTADGNKSKNATIASLVTSNAIDVVDTLNSLKGDINITGGSNITVTPSGQNIEISTSASNVDGSGTAGKIPKWSDSNTLTDSVINENNSNIGIGTTSTAVKLDILDTVNQTSIRVTNNNYNNYLIQKTRTDSSQTLGIKEFGSNGGLALVTAGTQRLNVNNLGNIGIGITSPLETLDVVGNIKTSGYLSLSKGSNTLKISTPATITTSYELVMPAAVGAASQVLKLPSTIGSTPYQLAWGDAGSDSGTGGFETLPFTTANGYLAGETSTGTYLFQMIAPSNCAPANFKFYNFLAQSAGRTTTVAIYKGVIGDEGAAGSLQSAGQIAGALGAAQISGSTLTVVDGATAISAGDNIVMCFSIDEEIQPLGVIPITSSSGTLTNASPVSNSKLAIHDPNVSLTAAEIQANYTTVTALEAFLTSSAATTTRPFLIIY
jgi:hypothetical protein